MCGVHATFTAYCAPIHAIITRFLTRKPSASLDFALQQSQFAAMPRCSALARPQAAAECHRGPIRPRAPRHTAPAPRGLTLFQPTQRVTVNLMTFSELGLSAEV